MDRIEEIIKEYSLSEGEVQDVREIMHQPEFRDRIFKKSQAYDTVFYDAVLRYIDRRPNYET
jgi:hypothetical protein